MLDELIERLAEKAPAATLFRSLFARIFHDDALDDVFSDHRQRQVESPLLFSYLVNLLVPVISGSSPSVNASHQASESEYSRQALYDKLKGVEPEVSAGLLRKTVDGLLAVRKSTRIQTRDVVKGYHTFVLDGKTFNATEHRLKETRADARAPLPGRAIALYDTRNELFVDIECDRNAHCCERKIVEPMLNRLMPGALYLADRNFCDGILLAKFFAREAFFVVRQHGVCPSWRKISGEPAKRCGVDSLGGKVFEQAIEVQLEDGTWKKVRRITVKLKTPTRDDDIEIHLLSNLPRRCSAKKIADAYRERWTIETCFGHLSRSLNAEIRTLCYPGAAGLCFALALVLFNIISAVKALLLKHGQFSDRYEIVDVSIYYLADEIARTHAGIDLFIDPSKWNCFATMKRGELTAFLKSTASHAQLAKYRKHPRGPTTPRPKRRFDGTRIIATQKLIDARN